LDQGKCQLSFFCCSVFSLLVQTFDCKLLKSSFFVLMQVHDNRLTSLPEAVGELKNLQRLSVG